jgi:hypothetical protein
MGGIGVMNMFCNIIFCALKDINTICSKANELLSNLIYEQPPTLIEINKNVTLFMTPCDLQLFTINLGIFVIIRSNFNYFGHSYNYDAIIGKTSSY